MGYLLVVAVVAILLALGIFALSAVMLVGGSLLGLLFAITTFQGALITTLVALGVLWTWPHDCGHMWEAISPHPSHGF